MDSGSEPQPEDELPIVRNQAFRVVVWSLAFGLALTTLFVTAAALKPPV